MHKDKTTGVIYAVAAYSLWGILPLYWKLINDINPLEILSNRVIWAFVFMLLIIALTKQWDQLKGIAKNKEQMRSILIASMLISINWGLYIWAVNSNRIVDASLGYYINPLLAVALGVFIFKEKLSRWTWVAIAVATLGVLIKTVGYGKMPWVSLVLAISFALYGAIKKSVKANSIIGMTLETAMIAPVAAIYIMARQNAGLGAYTTQSSFEILILIGAGIVTAVPLILFSSAAKRLPLSLVGLTQYLSPSLSLIIAVLVYHESFTIIDMTAFGFIWAALILYSITQFSFSKKLDNLREVS